MRITFVLPDVSPKPSGGVKIVYEYANRLTLRGHAVTVVHPRNWQQMPGPAQFVKARLWPLSVHLRYGGPVPWISTAQRLKQRLVPDLRPQFLPDADTVIATFFRTAPFINALPASKGRKFYLIQHYEDWAGTREEVDATWRLPMHKIVISLWLEEIARSFGEDNRTTRIPNAMDLDAFRLTRPIAGRPKRIVMLVNPVTFKGTDEGVEALSRIRRQFPAVEATCFGTAPRAASLPDWIEYRHLPSPEEMLGIYNSGSIFLQPSRSEGWGLTSTEAMACGCALVTTDNGGSRDFAIDGETALVVPVCDVDAMVSSMLRLLNDDALRQSLALSGQQYVQQFTWDRAVTALERTLSAH